MHHTPHAAELCVLSSSSRGNSSALLFNNHLILIDAGLSPRRTFALLAQRQLNHLPIAAVVLTHLDHDHWHQGWLSALPDRTTLFLHRRHLGRAGRQGMLYIRTHAFDSAFEPLPGLSFHALLLDHDDLGVACLRITVRHDALRGDLGFATDLGRPTQALADHLRGVDVLAIESNYCPQMQAASDRPAFLKDRITGGKGHLSNAQSAALARAIAPRSTAVLLHLSQQCNTPATALAHHTPAPWSVLVASPDQPTPRLPIREGLAATVHTPTPRISQPSLFT